MVKKEYFGFIKSKVGRLKYLETSKYVACGSSAADKPVDFLDRRDKNQGFFWSKQKSHRNAPFTFQSQHP